MGFHYTLSFFITLFCRPKVLLQYACQTLTNDIKNISTYVSVVLVFILETPHVTSVKTNKLNKAE